MKAISKNDLIIFRSYEANSDLGFVYRHWLKGLYHGWPYFQKIFEHENQFNILYSKIIDEICCKPTTQIKIACLKEDPDVLMGFSVSEGSTLHWIYVKDVWRRIGIAKDLLPEPLEAVTHLSLLGNLIKPKDVCYKPELI